MSNSRLTIRLSDELREKTWNYVQGRRKQFSKYSLNDAVVDGLKLVVASINPEPANYVDPKRFTTAPDEPKKLSKKTLTVSEKLAQIRQR